ncbi:extensin-like [Rhinatrema bivittatum]|nr:extensin-like [Rhinatrema bivittatum]
MEALTLELQNNLDNWQDSMAFFDRKCHLIEDCLNKLLFGASPRPPPSPDPESPTPSIKSIYIRPPSQTSLPPQTSLIVSHPQSPVLSFFPNPSPSSTRPPSPKPPLEEPPAEPDRPKTSKALWFRKIFRCFSGK